MLRAAIHGLGRWGQTLVESVHGKSETIRFVAGISRDPARHKDFIARTGIRVVDSYEAVLQDPEVDAVILATPHSQHQAQIEAAAAAGKHVYVEKPITLSAATARDAVEVVRKAGVTLGLGFNRRYAPAFVEMMRRIDADEIGEVLHVEGQHSGPTGYKLQPGNWRSTRTEAPGGGMTARGIHTLDSMIQVAGLVTSVFAHSDRRMLPPNIDIDDTTSMLLKFESGATGYLGTVFATAELWRVHVFGSKGWLEMRGDTELVRRGLEGPEERINLPKIDKERATLEAFAAAVAAGRQFVVPPEQAINGIAVLESIEVSSARGEAVLIEP